jgi:hypothetical protein
MDVPGFESWRGQEIFPFSKVPILARGGGPFNLLFGGLSGSFPEINLFINISRNY